MGIRKIQYCDVCDNSIRGAYYGISLRQLTDETSLEPRSIDICGSCLSNYTLYELWTRYEEKHGLSPGEGAVGE